MAKPIDLYKKNVGTLRLSWEDVEKDTLKIIDDMKHDNFEPDLIVSIARSGLIPAALIAYTLGNKQLYVVKIDFSKTQQDGKEQDLMERPVITQELTKDVRGLKILVVDEMAVSGSTLKMMKSYMDMKQPQEVRYAVLYKQPWSEFTPDYSGREIEAWPVYPWKELRNNVIDPRAKIA
ncbi:MAG: hypothetical protein A3J93_02305 [Candidatus Magasanikbacteria bacterium RIFOXYC2_FULL_42_28]|uniref:Phosphoribosyltransferase domain-containing protein n=1 Tax=Candidatus Magasanikbacteria bacterium RIFOXYC2_FULL_42_28 TaxID=1798704 RepID=A0A1F6NVM6_9BACT|nr:MAG: hypothetical protein A3J93_02305 [Candidatus Magasanikbacteria bacterium RIFOXYC2_FULL_42_28]